MSKPTILDLDEIEVGRVFKFKGKEYTLRSMTMREFVEVSKNEAEEAGKFEALTPSQKIVYLADRLLGQIDGMERETLQTMTLDQLLALMRFARGDEEGVVREGR